MRSVPVGTLLDLRRTAGPSAATLPKVLFDLRDDPVVRVEEARVRVRPAADQRRVDREQPRPVRVLAPPPSSPAGRPPISGESIVNSHGRFGYWLANFFAATGSTGR